MKAKHIFLHKYLLAVFEFLTLPIDNIQSTLFNALTESQGAEAANYPFCTIEPNNVRIIMLSSRTVSHLLNSNVLSCDFVGSSKCSRSPIRSSW